MASSDCNKKVEHQQLYSTLLFYFSVDSSSYSLPNTGNRCHPMRFYRRHIGQHYLTDRFRVCKGRSTAQGDILHDSLEGVPHRQYTDPDITGGHIDPVWYTSDLVQKILMRQHHSLRFAGCSGGKNNSSGIVACPLFNFLFDYIWFSI